MSDETSIFTSLKDKMGRPEKDEILEGSIISVMFKPGWPMMIATLLRTLYNLVDTFWLGHLPGDEAKYSVGAMGMSWSFVFLMLSIGIGFGVAALALVSQHTGSKKFDEAAKDAGQLYLIAIIFSVIIGIIGFFMTPIFLDFLTGSGAEAAELARYGTLYMRVIFLGLPLMFMFFAFSFIMRGWGDTITPMKITAIAVSLNLLFDPLLIFGVGPIPKLGIQGAAIATVTTRGVGSIYGMYLLFSGKVGIDVSLDDLKPDIERIKKFLSVGIPASAARLGSALGFIFIWYFINRLPNQSVAAAAYGAGNRILNMTFLIMGGLAMAMSTMVGQALGADREKRAEDVTKKGILVIVSLMALFAGGIFAARNVLIGIFIPHKPEVIKMGGEFLMIFSLAMPFFGVFRGISSILSGSGHTKQQMVLSLTRLWGLRIPLAYLFAFVLGWYASGIWFGMALSNVIGAGLSLFVYSLGWWKEKVISEGPGPGPGGPGSGPTFDESEDGE